MSYSAIVTQIKTKPHPNADRIQLGDANGFQVIVGVNINDGDLGVYFPCDGQLSDQFCQLNDLYPRYDEEGKKIGGGFFDSKNRRVKAQSFRGEKSYGFWCPISYFNHAEYDFGIHKLIEGYEFTEIDGLRICCKYETEKTRTRQKQQRKSHRAELAMFRMHFDTKQFKRELDNINLSKVNQIVITEKLHGTSGRVGYVLDDRLLKWYEKLLLKIGVKIQTKEWKYLNGSRRVVLEKSNGVGFYGSDEFRYNVVEKLIGNLHKGEVLYFEIVGYYDFDKPIMPIVSTSSLKDKSFTKQYGKEMTFSYGCDPSQSEMYVYRIVNYNEDGISHDLTWNQLKERCNELGIKYVPEIMNVGLFAEKEYIDAVVEEETNGSSLIDLSHIREGVCIRFEYPNEIKILKNKSFEFYVLEGVLKDEGVEDIEEAA